MEHEFKVGDVVLLKSGSPRMTITLIDKFGTGSTHDQAKCVWFERASQKEGLFELATLAKAPEGQPVRQQARFDRA